MCSRVVWCHDHPCGCHYLSKCVFCDHIGSTLLNYASVAFGQASNGGVFNVELGSSATFNVYSNFDHNSVQAEYSGGAVYAGGKVKQSLFDMYANCMPRTYTICHDFLRKLLLLFEVLKTRLVQLNDDASVQRYSTGP